MMSFLPSESPETRLEEIKKIYQKLSGMPLEIGSEDFAIASAVAYSLSAITERFNAMARQRFIDTASGEYLDALAKNLGVMSRPRDLKASCVVRVSTDHFLWVRKGVTSVIDKSGHIFTAGYTTSINAERAFDIVFFSQSSDVSNNGIETGEMSFTPETAGVTATNITESIGADPEPYPYTSEGDQAFRQYVIEQSAGLYSAGSASMYEAFTKRLSPQVSDARCLKQGDAGFKTGHVKIFITAIGTPDQDSVDALCRYLTESILASSSGRPVNDIIDPVRHADYYTDTVYIKIFYNENLYSQKYISDICEKGGNEYKKYLHSHIGYPFEEARLSEFISMYDTEKAIMGVSSWDPVINVSAHEIPFKNISFQYIESSDEGNQ